MTEPVTLLAGEPVQYALNVGYGAALYVYLSLYPRLWRHAKRGQQLSPLAPASGEARHKAAR